jgi:GT2 family glycosyltransferase
MMRVSVIILNWNGERFLKQYLPVLIKYTQPELAEIVVADNGSTDNSLLLLRNDFPNVRLITFDKNYGFAEGYNKALDQTDTEYTVILNSDVEVTPEWLLPMVDYMDKNTDVAACQPKILAFYDRSRFEHAGAAGGFIDMFGFPFCRGRVFTEVEKDTRQYDDVSDIFWASGACLFIRTDVFKKEGGFDADFFAHMEEIDLCWRLKNRGYRISCVPQSVVYHVGGGTLNTEHPHKTYLNYRNNLLMLYKNLPANKLWIVLIARYFFDYIAALQMYVTGKKPNALSVLKARSDFAVMKLFYKEKRKENLSKSIKKDISGIYNGSMVLARYIFGRNKFSELKNKISK